MKYNYFVYYTFRNGYGNTNVERDKEINTFKDIKFIEKQLLEENSRIKGLAISNFIKLSTTDSKETI